MFKLCTTISIFSHVFIIADEYNSFLDKVECELRSIVGMDELKRRLRLFATTSHVNTLRSQYRRVHIKRPVMVFRGNPGTGKTSVAHIVASKIHLKNKHVWLHYGQQKAAHYRAALFAMGSIFTWHPVKEIWWKGEFVKAYSMYSLKILDLLRWYWK